MFSHLHSPLINLKIDHKTKLS